jgi:hypothetical protein
MATTLPSLTRQIDNAFVTTWYEIRAEAIDNILDATVVWAALKGAGCLVPQSGGDLITRTISYGEEEATEIERGDMLPSGGDTELETMAIWRWRTIAGKVQRSMWDDQKNRGPSKIKDLVGVKLKAARDGLEQKLESQMFNPHQSSENTKKFQGLNDIIPPRATCTTGTYGGIQRPSAYTAEANGVEVPSAGNVWWGPKYLPGVLAQIEDDLLTDMKKLYNSVGNNQAFPNLILTTQTIFELYEDFALDASQIIKDESTRLADLGFEVLRFKGKPLIWSPGVTAGQVKMLNTDFVELVHDPDFWFDMTEWKPVALQPNRIAHIINFINAVSAQPRRHGQIEYA